MMKFSKNIFLFCAIVLLPGCWTKKEQTNAKLQVINVLDKEEFDDCHILGSKNVLLGEIDQFAQKLAKDTEIVVYCSNYQCTASGMVAKQLGSQGFNRVYAYEAGMAEWYQQGLPVKGSCKKSYLQKVISQPSDHDSLVNVITTQELYTKMKEAGMLKD